MGHKTSIIGRLDYFGESAILGGACKGITVTCASEQAELLVCTNQLEHILDKNAWERFLEWNVQQRTKISLKQFEIEGILGRGTYGVVKQARHKRTNIRYALKCIGRNSIVRQEKMEKILLEREILLENHHPFIAKGLCLFKDRLNFYLCTELVTGGDLFDVIRTIGLLTPPQAQFYTASLFLALEFLRERWIVHRDLKPENVLVDGLGYLKVSDFGSAKKLVGHTFTLLGTPHYMAPEVVMGDGYGFTCDLWGLGVCLYEFMCGSLPYGRGLQDPYKIFIAILTQKLVLPSQIDVSSRELIQKLLRRPTKLRVQFSEMRSHSFFRNLSFEKLLCRSLQAPHLPKERILDGAKNSQGDVSSGLSDLTEDTVNDF